jgi:phage terminase large subunit-like protein
VRLACDRHLKDLENSKALNYPYTFDPKAAHRICAFAENMVHIKGKWAEVPHRELPFIQLEDWQCFLFAVAFGWKRKADGRRRFREFYWEIARKNGKSVCVLCQTLPARIDD